MVAKDVIVLQRYESLIGEARTALLRLDALHRSGDRLDQGSRVALIEALQAGLDDLALTIQAGRSRSASQRQRQLARLIEHANLLIMETDNPPRVTRQSTSAR